MTIQFSTARYELFHGHKPHPVFAMWAFQVGADIKHFRGPLGLAMKAARAAFADAEAADGTVVIEIVP